MTDAGEATADVSERPEPRPASPPRASPFSPLLSLFRRSPKTGDLTGVGVTPEGVCLTHVDKSDAAPTLEVCDYKACFSTDEQADVLAALVETHALRHARCSTVMEPGTYTLHLVDAPNVEPGEMRAAIRWRVKELIDYSVDDAVVDVFDVPGRNLRGQGGRMIYVVVAHIAEVRKRIDLIEGAGLRLDIVDIPELALRNVAALLPEDREGVAMLHLTQHHGLITLTRRGTLYLARNLSVGIERLHRLRMHDITADGDQRTAALHNALDGIVLEIQRSLDYYERHCSNPPISRVVVTPLDDEIPGFIEYVAGSLGVEVKPLQAAGHLESFTHLHDSMLRNCLYTIGAALRHE